jgi:hypothetical protein
MNARCSAGNDICPQCGKPRFNQKGCIEHRLRLKLGVFDKYFTNQNNGFKPRSFSDRDAYCECQGYELQMEWKPTREAFAGASAQWTAAKNSSISGINTVLLVVGSISTMQPREFSLFVNGRHTGWQPCTNLDRIGDIIKCWEEWAMAQTKPPQIAQPPLIDEPRPRTGVLRNLDDHSQVARDLARLAEADRRLLFELLAATEVTRT